MASPCAGSCLLALSAFPGASGLESLAFLSSFSPCPCTLGHRFPCTTHRCEVGGSFLHLPQISAAVMENGNNSTGFPLLLILPLNSVQPPHFPCATPSNIPSRSLPEWWCIPLLGAMMSTRTLPKALLPPHHYLASKYTPFPLLVQSTALQ